jgi:hypothetical protein
MDGPECSAMMALSLSDTKPVHFCPWLRKAQVDRKKKNVFDKSVGKISE